jgi:hypothetical protein
VAWTSPRTWVSGETVTAALMNTHVRDNLKAIGDAWTSYTPTLTTWTLGNGTITGRYMFAGKLVIGYLKLTVGSTTATAGSVEISLPQTANIGAYAPIGNASCKDTAAANPYNVSAYMSTTGRMGFVMGGTSNVAINATNPFTWGTGDTLEVMFTYEAA